MAAPWVPAATRAVLRNNMPLVTKHTLEARMQDPSNWLEFGFGNYHSSWVFRGMFYGCVVRSLLTTDERLYLRRWMTAGTVTDAVGPQAGHLCRGLEVLVERRGRLDVFLLEGMATGKGRHRHQADQQSSFHHTSFHAPCFPATARLSSFNCKAPLCGAPSPSAALAAS